MFFFLHWFRWDTAVPLLRRAVRASIALLAAYRRAMPVEVTPLTTEGPDA